MTKLAFLFPGQGAQAVGMGMDLCEAFPEVADLFDRAESATSLAIRKLCFEGPEDDLNRTDMAQPAIFTVSAAMLKAVEATLSAEQLEQMRPSVMAGLSLGEYTALYAAGAMDFETGVKLVARRGELMQQAATATPSGMVSVIGLDEAQAAELCQAAGQGQVLTCANFNCPGQIVLSGETDACGRAAELAEQFGASGAVELKVAGAFHSDIMAPAAEGLTAELAEVDFAEPATPVIANVDAKPYAGAADVPGKLVAQLTSPVRWQQSMELLLADGLSGAYEIGPGRVLAGLMRRIDRKMKVVNVNSRQAAESFAKLPVEQDS
ncbi:MAG: ACP S-malonyltransferase [Planctomycetota bacterium]|jgi:[acyl-carrier-protein] S-malonyltransferase